MHPAASKPRLYHCMEREVCHSLSDKMKLTKFLKTYINPMSY